MKRLSIHNTHLSTISNTSGKKGYTLKPQYYFHITYSLGAKDKELVCTEDTFTVFSLWPYTLDISTPVRKLMGTSLCEVQLQQSILQRTIKCGILPHKVH